MGPESPPSRRVVTPRTFAYPAHIGARSASNDDAGGQGSAAAFEELVRRYDSDVLRLALRSVRSEEEARDIYQEAFLRTFRTLGGFRGECSFRTWLYRIVTNLCLDHARRHRA